MEHKENKNKTLQRAASVALALVIWQVGAMLIDQSVLLVTPVRVAVRLAELVTEKNFWATVLFSFRRIVLGFLLAFLLGTLMALLAGRFHVVETLLWPFVLTAKSVPVASFIIISLIWLSAGRLSTFISFLMVFPVIYSNVLQGIKSADVKLAQMARVYKMPWGRRLIYIYLMRIKPFLISACSVALGMAWKAGVAAEVIGIPDGSIGERLYEAKVYLNTADLLAWTVTIVVVSVVFEKLFLFILRKAFKGLEKL